MQIKVNSKPSGIPEATAAVSAGSSDGARRVVMFINAIDCFGIGSVAATLRMSPAEALDLADRIRKAAGG